MQAKENAAKARLAQRGKVAAEIHQSRIVAVAVGIDFVDGGIDDAVCADFVMADNVAVQMGECAFHLQLSFFAAMPNVLLKAFFGRKLGDAGKMFGNVLLLRRQGVDAQFAVGKQNRVNPRLPVYTQHHRRRFVGNRGNCRHGNAETAGSAVGRNHVHTGRAGSHCLSERLLGIVVHMLVFRLIRLPFRARLA